MAGKEIILILAFISASLANITPVCKPNTGQYSGPALPSLPSIFSTKYEGNFLNKNYTVIGEEYFDSSTDQVAILFASQNSRIYSISNYRKDERIIYNLKTRSCMRVSSINNSRFSILRPKFDNQSHEHVGSVSDFFQFGKKFNESFIGTTIIRGIRVLHWRSCAIQGNSSYSIDWFFSVPEWKTSGGKSPVPVRCVVNESTYRRNRGSHSFYHVYDFSDFLAGVHPEPYRFQPPFGTYCKNKAAGRPPPKLPNWFSMSAEIIVSNRKTASVITEHYDMERKLVRVDHFPWPRQKTKSLHLSDIHDFNTGVTYSIDDIKKTCEMSVLNQSWFGFRNDHDHDVHMRSPFAMFWRNNNSIKYDGETVVRGMETSVWVEQLKSNRSGRNGTYVREWYFSKKGWLVSAGHKNNQTEVPILHKIWSNKTNSMTFNIFNFDGENPKLSVFDVGICFPWKKSSRRLANILFTGDYKKVISGQEDTFLSMLMDRISKDVGITLLRMSGISVLGFFDTIWVKVTILERPTMEGQTVHMAKEEPELDEAFEKLQKIVENGKLKVKMPDQTTLTAEQFYESDHFDKKKPSKPGKKEKGVSVIGVAIGAVLLGWFIGVLVCFIVLKRRGVNLFSYQRHSDEL